MANVHRPTYPVHLTIPEGGFIYGRAYPNRDETWTVNTDRFKMPAALVKKIEQQSPHFIEIRLIVPFKDITFLDKDGNPLTPDLLEDDEDMTWT